MAEVTGMSGLPYPVLGDEPNIELAVKPLAEALDSRVNSRFATTTERDGAIVAPVAGQLCYVSTHGLMQYTTTWVPANGVQVLKVDHNTSQSLPNTTETLLTFNTNTYVPFGGHSTSVNPTRITPPFPGRYSITAKAGVSLAGGVNAYLYLSKNTVTMDGSLSGGYGITIGFTTTATDSFNGTTDYFEVKFSQTSGGSLSVGALASIRSTCSLIYHGPSL